jgi:hypothetical protein
MTHAPTPPPRPALRKAPDGTVHPASAVLSSLAVTVPRSGASEKKPGKKAIKKTEPDDTVDLVVSLPRSVRKALRRRAADYGWSAEEAAGHVLRVWADR